MKYIGISIFLIILSFTGAVTPVRDVFIKFSSPMQFGMRKFALSIKDVFSFYSNVKNVREENISLITKVNELQDEIVQLKRVVEENEVLKEQLNVGSSENPVRNFVLTNVMGNPNDLTGTTIILDKGSFDNIKPGDNVIKGNYLVGITRKVFGSSSIVELITSPNISITVYNIDSETKTEGLAKGEHGSSMNVERILQDEQVDIDDVFVSSGKDGVFKPGFYVGKVYNAITDPAQPFKIASIETVLDFSNLDKVFVLVSEEEKLTE